MGWHWLKINWPRNLSRPPLGIINHPDVDDTHIRALCRTIAAVYPDWPNPSDAPQS